MSARVIWAGLPTCAFQDYPGPSRPSLRPAVHGGDQVRPPKRRGRRTPGDMGSHRRTFVRPNLILECSEKWEKILFHAPVQLISFPQISQMIICRVSFFWTIGFWTSLFVCFCLLVDKGGVRRGGELWDGRDLQETPAADSLSTVHLQHLCFCRRTVDAAAHLTQTEREKHRLTVSVMCVPKRSMNVTLIVELLLHWLAKKFVLL